MDRRDSHGGSITVTWLGHSTVVLDLEGARIVTDPLLRRHNGILRRRGGQPPRRQWLGADVLVSHLHHDHAELSWLRRKGLDGRGLSEGQWVALGDRGHVTVRLVPAAHRSRRMPHRPNAANGHLVRSVSGIAWVAGDTEVYPEMAALADMAGGRIDLAVVPIGGWDRGSRPVTWARRRPPSPAV